MTCTTEKPCLSPMLRWVHSDRCTIATLHTERKALRDERKVMLRMIVDLLGTLGGCITAPPCGDCAYCRAAVMLQRLRMTGAPSPDTTGGGRKP